MCTDDEETILIIPPDVDVYALGEHVMHGEPIPPRCHYESLKEWMARGRVDDCDCGLMQCVCISIRPHTPECAFRLSLTSVIDVGILECDCLP